MLDHEDGREPPAKVVRPFQVGLVTPRCAVTILPKMFTSCLIRSPQRSQSDILTC